MTLRIGDWVRVKTYSTLFGEMPILQGRVGVIKSTHSVHDQHGLVELYHVLLDGNEVVTIFSKGLIEKIQHRSIDDG
jgi:hypothetical protein